MLPYRLDDQVGFILRQAMQRHAAVFASGIGCDLTPTQWAALAKLHEAGPPSQNRLGRQTTMDTLHFLGRGTAMRPATRERSVQTTVGMARPTRVTRSFDETASFP